MLVGTGAPAPCRMGDPRAMSINLFNNNTLAQFIRHHQKKSSKLLI